MTGQGPENTKRVSRAGYLRKRVLQVWPTWLAADPLAGHAG